MDFNSLVKRIALKLRHYVLALSLRVRNEKNTWNSDCVRFGERIDSEGTGSEVREDRGC